MVYCKNCGAEVPTEDICPKCGTLVEGEVEVVQEVVEQIPVKDPGKVLGIVSLILGIVSIVGNCCTCIPVISWIVAFALPIFAIVGLILGIVGMKKSKKAGFKNTFAIIGLIISIVGIIIAIVSIVLSVFGLSMFAIAGASGAFE